MDIYQELIERDLVAQVTNEEKVKELLRKGNIPFYIGFEPTADSLHVGHFVQIMIMSRLQKAGHIPFPLGRAIFASINPYLKSNFFSGCYSCRCIFASFI